MSSNRKFSNYEEFEEEYSKHHTCGIPMIPYDLAYSSDCPRCCPEWNQWKGKCKEAWDADRTEYVNGWWYSAEEVRQREQV